MPDTGSLAIAFGRAGLAEALARFGASLLREGSSPAVTAIIRLAIAEAERAPELARRLDAEGRQPTRAALADFLARAAERGLVAGAGADVMTAQFFALLWGDLQMALLLRLAEPLSETAIDRRARAATAALLALYPASLNLG